MKIFKSLKFYMLTFFLAFAVTAFVQCDLSTTADEDESTTTSSSSTSSTSSSTSGGTGTGSIKITNNSEYDIYYLRISPASNANWGPDQLGSNVISTGGDYFTVTSIPVGDYEVRVETSTTYGLCAYADVTVTANTTYNLSMPYGQWGSCSYKSMINDAKNASVKSAGKEASFDGSFNENSPKK